MNDYAKKLQAPFHSDDIEWRVQQAGISNAGKPYAMVLAYVTNRAIQSRLDEVFGVFGWKNIYRDMDNKAVECGISVYNELTKEWVTKYDAADETDIESTKGGRSNAMKRAAVQLGIGRYLYKLDATFAECAPNNSYPNRQTFTKKGSQEKVYGSWKTPDLPAWALPNDEPQQGALTIAQTMLMLGDAFGCYMLSKEAEAESDEALARLHWQIKGTVGDGLKAVVSDRFSSLVADGAEFELILSNAVVDGDAETVKEITKSMSNATKRLFVKYDPETAKAVKEIMS